MSDTRRILVVDDDDDIAALAAMVLKRAGYAVDTAGSGAQALSMTDGPAYDLVLLDINMPGMDGWEVLHILKADDRTALMPVVMFSVRGEVRDKVHGLQDGAFDYITKPFSVDGLVERVSTILAQRSAPSTGAP